MDCYNVYEELIQRIRQYHPAESLQLIEDAYKFAVKAHEGKYRNSGEPYIIHPLSVAYILAELELDLESMAAGILHDVVEDTNYTNEDILNNFNAEIALLVEGLTKLSKFQYTSKVEEQAENYRKMFLAISRDIRVIFIKIADRLHNMRTLKFHSPEKQFEIAQETLDIYAPLAHRLGVSRLKQELEDLCFKHLQPDAYKKLAEQINMKRSERQSFVDKTVSELAVLLNANNVKASVEGRPKHFFSIYKKMIANDKTLDEIFDLFAVRILVDDENTCYAVLGFLHMNYNYMAGRSKDYIRVPKTNHYRSLHTTLLSETGEPFEVQIRSWEMHKVAEFGIAAHWKYKNSGKGVVDKVKEDEKMSWLNQILEWQMDLPDDKEYIEAIKKDLSIYTTHVYCFTPKGEVISLIKGSTPIDYAYSIHSAVGNKMVGARVNGRIVTFDYVLETGDRVEIITNNQSKGPSRDWLKLIKTTHAKNKINQFFKSEYRSENIKKGKSLLEREAKKKNTDLSLLLAGGREAAALEKFHFQDFDSLCAVVGYGGLKEAQVVNKLFEDYQQAQPVPHLSEQEIINDTVDEETDAAERERKKRSGIIVMGIGDTNVRFPKCCSPLPGDVIVGYITRGRGVSIHRDSCANITNLSDLDRERIIAAIWLDEHSKNAAAYYTELRITGTDRLSLLSDISRTLKDERVRVTYMNARTDNNGTVVTVSIEISSRERLGAVCAKLQRLKGIIGIERVTA
ncbi:MAG: bifunctional (p)ppGpp synthetase/guanosine-3',5'-bis(diphosphate) 3'-pyrophosphohydrolase [Defluviitaleaceae bacterium]|nr:bifunctional (p)ppGpp synthetase/guanosine-3',5'-bis(diphosphate) 3'-pyrophosphohydrolase [Defluviitaleaceae bacterium]